MAGPSPIQDGALSQAWPAGDLVRAGDHELAKCRMTGVTAKQRSQRGYAVPHQAIVPDREQQLMRQIDQSVHDRSRTEQERMPASQEGREHPVAAGTGISIPVGFIHDHEARTNRRECTSTDALVRVSFDGDVELFSGALPLLEQRGWCQDY